MTSFLIKKKRNIRICDVTVLAFSFLWKKITTTKSETRKKLFWVMEEYIVFSASVKVGKKRIHERFHLLVEIKSSRIFDFGWYLQIITIVIHVRLNLNKLKHNKQTFESFRSEFWSVAKKIKKERYFFYSFKKYIVLAAVCLRCRIFFLQRAFGIP